MTRNPESHHHTASVFRSEAQTRREAQPAFAATLDQWAENATRRGDEAAARNQPDLFTERNAA